LGVANVAEQRVYRQEPPEARLIVAGMGIVQARLRVALIVGELVARRATGRISPLAAERIASCRKALPRKTSGQDTRNTVAPSPTCGTRLGSSLPSLGS
jgi:hypothetical protein